MDRPADEVVLPGGRSTAVVRVGDTVRRPAGPWTPTVHAYLRHLAGRGFTGAPRVLGVDAAGREVLEHVPGEVPSNAAWRPGTANRLPADALGDDALAATGALVRALHDAARGFRPTDPVWREHDRPWGPRQIVCHGDLGPFNTVYRGGRPVALIDWDTARPDLPELELLRGAWEYVPLGDAAHCRAAGFPEPPDVARRLRVLVDAYGLGGPDRIIALLARAQAREAERVRFWPHLTPAERAAWVRWPAERLAWLAADAPRLRRALADG